MPVSKLISRGEKWKKISKNLFRSAPHVAPEKVADILTRALDDPIPEVQMEVVKVLERISDQVGSDKVMELLSMILEDAAPGIKREALKMLSQMA